MASTHPLGCHREWIPNRLVFEHVIAALVHGSGYERIATSGCSDRTIRRRLADWAEMGLAEQVHRLALAAYERMIGLDLADLAVDGCITQAPGGGEVAGRSPVDRSKQGLKRSVLTEGAGIPLHVIPAGANRHDARRCTEKRRVIVEFYLFLAAALVVLRQLIQQARLCYRWPTRPTTRRLR